MDSPYERGLAALDAGHLEQAVAAFGESLAAEPPPARRTEAHNKRGVALVALGRRDEALADFCAALDYDERCAPALVNLGNLLLEAGHLHDAIDYYEAALRIDDASAGAHRNLGIAYKRAGRHADAVRHLRAAVRHEIRAALPGRRR